MHKGWKVNQRLPNPRRDRHVPDRMYCQQIKRNAKAELSKSQVKNSNNITNKQNIYRELIKRLVVLLTNKEIAKESELIFCCLSCLANGTYFEK